MEYLTPPFVNNFFSLFFLCILYKIYKLSHQKINDKILLLMNKTLFLISKNMINKLLLFILIAMKKLYYV